MPGAREILQPGTCDWGLGELGTNPCVLFLRHGGMHLAQGLGFVNDEAERQALLGIAEDCPTSTVVYEPTP